MREIKFRAWNGHLKKWDYFTLVNISMYLQSLELHLINADEFYLFTGLLDKNGKEIWEGDIVKFYFCADHPCAISPKEDEDITEMIDEVKFIDGTFFFWNYSVNEGAFAWRWDSRCEVIGNIYENPELLKDIENAEL